MLLTIYKISYLIYPFTFKLRIIQYFIKIQLYVFSTTVTNSIATKLNSSAVSTFGLTLIDDATADDALTTLGIDGAKVKTLYEAETNAFTDAQFTKLAGIETSATADQTGAEIKTLYEAESDTNALTDALLTKLNNIEANATADQTASEIKTAYESNANTNAFTDTQVSQLTSLQAGVPYSPQAGSSNLTTTGALTSGSIGSGFGAINIGTNAVSAGSANLSGNLSAGTINVTGGSSGNWNTAYNWGDHSVAGYLTSQTSHADVVVDGDFSSAGIMATNGSGTYSIVTDNSSNWDVAFGWGNHASVGYLTSFTETSHADVVVDGDFGSAGLMATNGSGTYSIISDSSSNWDSAFGWGNHASAGYLTTSSASSTYAPLASPALTGTPTAPTPSSSDNSTKIPTTAWVTSKITASGGMTALSDDSSPQLSGTLDANGNVIDMGSNNITDTKVGQWDTAYGWGNHASGGYLTTSSASSTYANLTGANFTGDITTTGKVLFSNLYANSSAYPSASTYHGCVIHDHSLGALLFSHSNSWIQVATNSQLANSSNWDSAYGWGNHASAGYLTSQTSHSDVVVDGDFSSNGIMTRTGAGSYAMLTDNSSNWDSAFGWGNHASAGYLTGITGQSLYSLSNVYSSSSPSDGQVLTWDNANSYWKPTTVSGGGGGGLSQSQVEAIAEENAIAMAIALG